MAPLASFRVMIPDDLRSFRGFKISSFFVAIGILTALMASCVGTMAALMAVLPASPKVFRTSLKALAGLILGRPIPSVELLGSRISAAMPRRTPTAVFWQWVDGSVCGADDFIGSFGGVSLSV